MKLSAWPLFKLSSGQIRNRTFSLDTLDTIKALSSVYNCDDHLHLHSVIFVVQIHGVEVFIVFITCTVSLLFLYSFSDNQDKSETIFSDLDLKDTGAMKFSLIFLLGAAAGPSRRESGAITRGAFVIARWTPGNWRAQPFDWHPVLICKEVGNERLLMQLPLEKPVPYYWLDDLSNIKTSLPKK